MYEISIPIIDISQSPYSDGPIKIPLNYAEIKKKNLLKDVEEDPVLIVQVEDWSSFESNFAVPPATFFEDN